MAAGARLLWLAAWAPAAAGQFGGPGGGGAGYTPPPPQCPSFTCPAKQKPIAKEGAKVWAYGCKDSGVNFLDTSSFNVNDPLAGLGGMGKRKNSVDKCCVEKEICLRTCGMTAAACHNHFQKCSKKICKNDSNCNMMATLADIMSGSLEDDPAAQKEDPKCKVYNEAQRTACECVAKDSYESIVETRLKSFYKSYNPEKLDKTGEIKDTQSIWKQWKGKVPDMFFALTTKYKDKAVEIREKPKPDYSKMAKAAGAKADPPGEEDGAFEEEAAAPGPAPPPEEAAAEAEEDDGGFSTKLRDLEARKSRAAEDEDYDLAGELKAQESELKRTELKRLVAEKAAAVEGEDYLKAKKLKARMAALDPKNEL